MTVTNANCRDGLRKGGDASVHARADKEFAETDDGFDLVLIVGPTETKKAVRVSLLQPFVDVVGTKGIAF